MGWIHVQDEILRKAVQRFKGKNWKKIGMFVNLYVYVQASCKNEDCFFIFSHFIIFSFNKLFKLLAFFAISEFFMGNELSFV